MKLPRDIVLFSTADWDHPFWTNKQHVACHLVERGFRVLYVDSLGLRRPSGARRDLTRIGRKLLRAGGGLRQVRPNLHVLSPLVLPMHASAWARRLNERLLLTLIRGATRRLGFHQPMVWTYNPLVGPLAERLGSPLLVYHCVDDLSAAPHLPHEAIQQGEAYLARHAEVIFTTSPGLKERFARDFGRETSYFPNVVDYEHFSRARAHGPIPDSLAAIPRPRIGFIGAVSEYKLDFGLIVGAAEARPDLHWAMIGPQGEGQPETSIARLRRPNIHFLGPRPYADLPDYLRGFDVAVIPAAKNPYTAAMFPMKFFEYLAAGRAVVASNVPALAGFSRACCLADTPGDFVRAIDGILAGEFPHLARAHELAAQHTWDARLSAMLNVLEQSRPRETGLRRAA